MLYRWRTYEQQLGLLIEALRADALSLPNLEAATAQGRRDSLTVMLKPHNN
jgi:hypothetical protein